MDDNVIRLTLPTIQVGPEEAKAEEDQNINDLILNSGGEETQEPNQNVNELITNAEPYQEPETSTLSGEWKQRLEALDRYTKLFLKGSSPTLVGATAGGALAGPPGAVFGAVSIPIADMITGLANKSLDTHMKLPSEAIAHLVAPNIEPPKTSGERVAYASGSALGGTASELGTLSRLAQTTSNPVTQQLANQLVQRSGTQLATAAPIGATAQTINENVDSPFAPLLGLVAGGVIGGTAGLRTTAKSAETVSAESLAAESSNLFQKAKESGITFDKDNFANTAKSFGSDLREEGYTPKSYPKIESVLDEMQNIATPKDFTELKSIRKMIQGAQKSTDAEERRLATILKDKFDDYVVNAPEGFIKTGSKEGLDAWKSARDSYSKLKKAEMFTDMLENAEIEGRTRYTNAGPEHSLARQLTALVKNDKKMRMFTADEQQAIRDAAKGGSAQNILKVMGKFAPTGVVSAMFSTMLGAVAPKIVIPAAAVSTVAKKVAAQQRMQDVNNLADMMRLGRKPALESRLTDVPITTLGGTIASQKTNKKRLTDLIPK